MAADSRDLLATCMTYLGASMCVLSVYSFYALYCYFIQDQRFVVQKFHETPWMLIFMIKFLCDCTNFSWFMLLRPQFAMSLHSLSEKRHLSSTLIQFTHPRITQPRTSFTCTHAEHAQHIVTHPPFQILVRKIWSQITKFTKILCHENLELYGY